MRASRQKPGMKKPVVLMLHGSGSSAAIFGIQTHMLAKELSRTFDLTYLDGPTPSAPGPGVLPLFAGMPGYYRWISGAGQSGLAYRLSELFEVARHIQVQLDAQHIQPEQVVGIIGFSQGALVALALLGLRHVGQALWTNLRFSISIAGGASGSEEQLNNIETLIGLLASMVGRTDGRYPGFTGHAMGLQDVWYKDGRRLAAMCAEDRTKTMAFQDGHVVPRKRADVAKLVRLIGDVDQSSRAGLVAPVLDSLEGMPSMMAGDSMMESMAFLSAHGIAV